MNITLVGYGKMNRGIEEIATQQGHNIIARIDPVLRTALTDIPLETDVVIDFSTSDAVLQNMHYYAEKSMKALIGTTGWYEHLPEIEILFQNNPGALLWASNCAAGVHIYLRVIEYLANMMNGFSHFSVRGREYHHKSKKDTPSGTAASINLIIQNAIIRLGNQGNIFTSERGDITEFEHEVVFDLGDEHISVIHHGRNRTIYAQGAIQAATWIVSRTGYYTMHEWIAGQLQTY